MSGKKHLKAKNTDDQSKKNAEQRKLKKLQEQLTASTEVLEIMKQIIADKSADGSKNVVLNSEKPDAKKNEKSPEVPESNNTQKLKK